MMVSDNIAKRPRHLFAGVLLTSVFLVASQVQADHHAPARDGSVCAPDGIALGGYDVVSYHRADGPVAGVAMYSAEHDTLIYLFTNAVNRDAFVAEPDRYLPSYMGWCSTNLSMGRLACPDFTNFKIEDRRLLLFERVGFTNGRDVWDSDPLTHRTQADANFLRLSGK
jgi:hypothetical protein